jgi:hypothetical protein
MEKLFVKLINYVSVLGNITDASMYRSGEYSSICAEDYDGQYVISISISKKEKENEVREND